MSALWGCSNAAAALTQPSPSLWLESPQLPTWMEYMMILKQRVAKIFGSQSEWLSRWLGKRWKRKGTVTAGPPRHAVSGDSQEQQGASDTGESRATNCSLKPFFSATGIYPVPFSLNASEKESLKPAHRLQHAARGARAFTPAPTLIICFSVPSWRKRRRPNLHEDGFDGVLDVAVRRPAQQLPQAPLRQLRGALLLLLRSLQRRGGAAVKAEEGDKSGAERAEAEGGEEARSPDGEGMEQNCRGIRLEPLLPRVTLPGRHRGTAQA